MRRQGLGLSMLGLALVAPMLPILTVLVAVAAPSGKGVSVADGREEVT